MAVSEQYYRRLSFDGSSGYVAFLYTHSHVATESSIGTQHTVSIVTPQQK